MFKTIGQTYDWKIDLANNYLNNCLPNDKIIKNIIFPVYLPMLLSDNPRTFVR